MNSTLEVEAPDVYVPDSLVFVDNVDEVWEEASPLIAQALEGSDDTAEEIYVLLKKGMCFLMESAKAYVVLEQVAAKQGQFDVLVWVAASRGATDCLKTHLGDLEQLAFAAGARCIVFRSHRKGFSRLLPDDWTPMQTLYGKRLH